MKKIFTLMIALIAITSVFAQSGRYDGYDQGRYDRGYNTPSYGSDHQVYDHHDAGYGSYDNHDYDRDRRYDRYDRGYGRSYPVYENRRYSRDYGYGDYDRRDNRSRTMKAVGAGLIVGGIITILASH